MADVDREVDLIEIEIGELKSRLAEAVVQENEANRIHLQQQQQRMGGFVPSFQDHQQQEIVHQQIMNQIAQNKLTLMTRLRRVETQLNMLKMQQQSHRDQPMLPHLMPQQHQLTRPFMQSNDLSHQSPSNELGSPFHSRNAQHVPGVETPQRFHRPPPRCELEMSESWNQPQQYQHPQRYPPPRYSPGANNPRYPSSNDTSSFSGSSNYSMYKEEVPPHSELSSSSRQPSQFTKYPFPSQQGISQSKSIIHSSSVRTLSSSGDNTGSPTFSSASPSKEFFINNRELFNKARYDSEPEYREWCLKYNIVTINDHGIKRSQMNNAAGIVPVETTYNQNSHSSRDSDYRSTSNLNSRGDSDFRQRSFQTASSLNHSAFNPEQEKYEREYFGRGVGFNTNHFNAQRNVSGQQPATLDIDDRANYSSTNHLSHRPISEQVPTGSSNTNTRTLGSSYRGAERNDRERSSVDGPKFEQEFFDENHGPEPGHPYYHIWYNKFIKKTLSSRHLVSTAVAKKLVDSDYRNMRSEHLSSRRGTVNQFKALEKQEEDIRIVTPPPLPHSRLRSSSARTPADMDLDDEPEQQMTTDRHSMRRRYRRDEKEMMQLDNDDDSLSQSSPPPPPLPPPPLEPPPEAPEKPADVYQLDQMLSVPGRVEQQRLRNTLIIIRGPPGAGKSHLAKIIKDKEVAAGMTPPRILSIDDYFMVANEGSKDCGGMVYEYEAEMEEVYLSAVAKAFSKTVSEGKDRLVIIDACNHLLKHFIQFVNIAQQNLIKVFIIDLQPNMELCLEQNTHKRSEEEIKNIIINWEDAPNTLPRLDASHFMKKQSHNNNSSSKQKENKGKGEGGDVNKPGGYSSINAAKLLGNKQEGLQLMSGVTKDQFDGDVFEEGANDIDRGPNSATRKRQRSDSLELSDAEQEETTTNDTKNKTAFAAKNKVKTSSGTYTFAAVKTKSSINNESNVNLMMSRTEAESSSSFSHPSVASSCLATGTSSDDVIGGSSCPAHKKEERDCSDSDSDSDYSSSPLFSSSSTLKLKNQVQQIVKSKWEILDNTEHNTLDKMDGLRGISKENKTKGSCKSGDIEGSNSDNDSVVSDDDAGSGEGRSSPKMTSSNRRETIEDFLSSCGSEYYQRSSATATGGDKSKANGGPAKKRVRWADVEERREIEQEKRLGFIVGRTNWHRLMNEEQATTAALTKTKFI